MSEPIANVDMANAWDGEEGDQWTQFADEYDASVRSIWAALSRDGPDRAGRSCARHRLRLRSVDS